MPENQPSGTSNAAQPQTIPELPPKEFEQLADMVYKLLGDEMLIELERRGATSMRHGR